MNFVSGTYRCGRPAGRPYNVGNIGNIILGEFCWDNLWIAPTIFFALSQKLMVKKMREAACFFNNSFLKISGVKLLDFK